MSKYAAIDGPAECCVFCEADVEAHAGEAEIALMSDYVDTPLGEETPGYRVGLCGHHLELLCQRVPKSDGEDLVVR
ncbi:hypothetical protein ACLI4U_19070 (plasmid) [Natrialbaceae archaeon A-CW2]